MRICMNDGCENEARILYCSKKCGYTASNRRHQKDKVKPKETPILEPIEVKRTRYRVKYQEPKPKLCTFAGCGAKFTAVYIDEVKCEACDAKLKKLQAESNKYPKAANFYDDDSHLNPQSVSI